MSWRYDGDVVANCSKMVVYCGNMVVKHDKTNHNGDILLRHHIENISPTKWGIWVLSKIVIKDLLQICSILMGQWWATIRSGECLIFRQSNLVSDLETLHTDCVHMEACWGLSLPRCWVVATPWDGKNGRMPLHEKQCSAWNLQVFSRTNFGTCR